MRLGPGLALQLGHRLGHHLDVEVVADGGDVAGLVAPEQVAGPADLQVAQGDLEARAQLGVVPDGPQALVGRLGQDPVGGVEQVGVGPHAGPAHPAPQLVELAQPEQVGPVDHQRVDGGHVDARLDDGRAHQHVVLALPEVEDDLLERALVHLPVGDGHPGLGGHLAHPVGRRRRCPGPGCARRTPGPRGSSSRRMASEAAASSNSPTWVRMGRRAAGGVLTIERSRMPVRAISSVRGMGLAVSVRTSTPSAIALIDSLWLTPKRCSSSTTRRPSFLNVTSWPSSRWVPTTTSMEPSASPARTP